MSADPGDLANMADLALPPAVSFWPPAAGVWIVGGTLLALSFVTAWRAVRRYRADAYLREARAELDRLRAAPEVEQVSGILKRVAMVAYGREKVASLTGKSWGDFLARTAPGRGLDDLAAGLDRSEPQALGRIAAQAGSWLRGQRGRASRES